MWILPTKNRPELCLRFLQQAVATKMSTKLLVVVDGVDGNGDYDRCEEYCDAVDNFELIFMGAEMTLGPTLNEILRRYPNESWYGLVTDDHFPITNNWDTILVNQVYQLYKPIVSSNDGWQAPTRMHGATVFQGDFVRKVGYFAPLGMNHMYIDDVWETIGRATNTWHVDLTTLVEHRHVLNNKMTADETHTNAAKWLESDRVVFSAWRQTLPIVLERLGFPTQQNQQVSAHDLSKLRVCISTPTHDGRLSVEYVRGLVETVATLHQYGIAVEHQTIAGDSMLPRARNELVKQFYGSESTHMLFVDSDIGFTADDVLRLLSYNRPLVAAAGPRRTRHTGEPPQYCCEIDTTKPPEFTHDGLLKVKRVGTGFMMIRRDCVQKMYETYHETNSFIDPQTGLETIALFDFAYENRLLYGEDYVFCTRWTDIGGEVFIDPFISLTHVGMATYGGCLGDLMEQIPQQEAAQ